MVEKLDVMRVHLCPAFQIQSDVPIAEWRGSVDWTALPNTSRLPDIERFTT
jgi:hypothetical protein